MTTQNAWVRFPKPNPQATCRVFCFPYAGGGASIVRTWPAPVPASLEICSFELPGREDRLREAPFDRLDVLVQVLLSVLRPYLDKPFALFGHSMGALISYELACQLSQRYGMSPIHLFVAGRHAPHVPDVETPLHHLAASLFLAEVRQRYDGIPEAVWQDAEFMTMMLPLLRADFTLIETYTHRMNDALPSAISAFGGLEDASVSQQDLLAWREQTRGAFKLCMLPGDHFFLNQDASPLLAAIAQDLANHQIAIRS